jgi:YbbR domain-containing protein
LVNSVKPPTKPAPVQKPTKKVPVQKVPVQCSSAKGKEKAEYTPSSKSTSVLGETDSLTDEDQIMAEIENICYNFS